jgi:uncharacterized protein
MVLIIEGFPYFVFPDRLKAYLTKLLDIQDSTLRVMGLLAMLTGLLLLYYGRM